MVAAMLLVVAGCGQDAGVLIEVTRDDTVPAALGRIELHIGVSGIGGQPARFIDPDPEADVRLEGRDLAADPFRLFLRPRDYPDAELMVAVIAYASGEVVGFGSLEQPVSFVDGEVVRWRIVLTGELPDGLATTDTDCLSWLGADGERVTIGDPKDKDCDDWRAEDDCDDLDPRVNPGAAEVCGNDVDEDCDQAVDEDVDEDGDQITTCGGDCDDGDPTVSPAAEELCDGIDNDCNALCDEADDADGDTFTTCGSQIVDGGRECLFDPALADCDDLDADVSPGAAEVCDGIDNDCDRVCDNSGGELDRDGDGFTACGSIADHCGLSDLYVDCQDEDGEVHPGAAELCNGVDDDCDGDLLQRGPCFAIDPDTGGGCHLGERDCAEQPGDPGTWEGPCRPLLDPVLDAAPDAVCATYDECDAALDPDPYTCAIESEGSGLVIEPCRVSFQIATGEQCGGQEVLLPTDDLLDCSWAVVGGVDQGDYLVGLRAIDLPDDTPQPTLAVCGAVLVVTQRAPGPPSPHVLLLSRTDDLLATSFVAVSLESDATDDCEPRGLECQGLPPPP